MSVHKKFNLIGPAVWPAIRNIYMYEYKNLSIICFYLQMKFNIVISRSIEVPGVASDI